MPGCRICEIEKLPDAKGKNRSLDLSDEKPRDGDTVQLCAAFAVTSISHKL